MDASFVFIGFAVTDNRIIPPWFFACHLSPYLINAFIMRVFPVTDISWWQVTLR
jgi:hypothetical protein